MSVTLFRLFVNTLRKNLPRAHLKSVSALQVRRVTVMDVAVDKVEKTDNKLDNADIIRNKNMTRYKRRFVKRQWDEPDPKKKENGESEEKKPCERIKKKKMALLLGYCGVDYYGMQRNPGVRTIEEELMKALLDAKYVTEEDFNSQQNTQFQRSSRTDKGVSAARQVVSMKLPLEATKEEINKRLPESIKVFGIKRVTNKFNSKSKCNARTYSYTLPTYVFEPSLVTEQERKQYRITPEKLEKVSKVLEVYKGTKGYHNFTEKKHYQDPSSLRYMMGFKVEKVFVESDMEFAVLLVKGQSFMLHQIRKMVGLAIAVLRGLADITIMDKAFGKEKVMIPTAPGLGLVLDMVHYESYDAKFKNSHGSLTWDAEEETIQKFKHEHIYPNIVSGEIEGHSMAEWLETKLSHHSFEPSDNTEDTADGPKDDDDDDDDGKDDDDDDDMKVDEESVKCDDMKCDNSVKSNDVSVKVDKVSVKCDDSGVTCDNSVISNDVSVKVDEGSLKYDDSGVKSDNSVIRDDVSVITDQISDKESNKA